MASVAGLFFLILIISLMAGYAAVRAFGKGLETDIQFAVMPLAGASLTAIILQFLHAFGPLSLNSRYLALVPAAAGLLLLCKDLFSGKFRPHWAAVLLLVIAVGCALSPFAILGRLTTFGIINNDGFYYAASDYLVQHTTYGEPAPGSLLVASAATIKRYGIDYLSTLLQMLTGLRSWQTVHLTGGFGLLLSMAAGYLLTRGLGGSIAAAAVAGLVVGTNHWVFRLYMEAVLAFMFGLAFLLASLWACTLNRVPGLPRRTVVGMAGLMLCGLTVFYFDLLPIFGVVAVAMAVVGLLFRQNLQFPAISVAALMLLPVDVLKQMISHFLLVSSVPGPGRHFDFGKMDRTALHLTGMMDVYDYMYWPGSVTALHVIGAVAVLGLLGLALWSVRRQPAAAVFGLAVVFPLLALCSLLVYQGREYHAHRALTVAASCAVPAIAALASAAAVRKAVQTALVAAALAGIAQADWRILDRFRQQNIIITDAEKQIGEEWIPRLDKHAVVLIALPPDAKAFEAHYLYLETATAMGGEDRIIMPYVLGSYLPAQPLSKLAISKATHVLQRRNSPPVVSGALQPVAANDRYELLSVSPGTQLAISSPRPAI